MDAEFKPSGSTIEQRTRSLLAWFDRQKRDLPWRRHPSLYGTWIAETMLQQTTVATVAARWLAFLKRFPDVQALANADQSEVLSAWSGLGYYRRAHMLHQAARQIVSQHRGRLPRSFDLWRRLPGIGDYTAAAIVSIGLGIAVPAVDVNVRRVLMRWTCAEERKARAMTQANLRSLAAAHLDCGRPADWNQAMMDLGAGICRAKVADCCQCPVMRWCAAGQAGTADRVPLPARQRPAMMVQLSVLLLNDGQNTLWLPSESAVVARVAGLGRPLRASLKGLLPGMWSPPMTCWYDADAHGGDDNFLACWRRWLRGLGWVRPKIEVARSYRHAITTHRLRVLPVTACWPENVPLPDLHPANWSTMARTPPLSSLARQSLTRVIHEGPTTEG